MVLKQFDFFRKIQTQQELSSATGGCFTIGSFIVAGILVLLSIKDFTSINYMTSLQVKNDPTEYIPMKIDIYFNKAPLIEIKFHDELDYLEAGLQRNLSLFEVKENQEIAYRSRERREETVERLKNAVEKRQGCRIEGILNLPKTPGVLSFDIEGSLNQELDNGKRSLIQLSYFLKKLEFGEALQPFELPVTHSSQTVEEYIKKLEGDIGNRTFVQDFRNVEKRLNFYNHLKIIPIYVDDGTYSSEKDKQKYRYSLRAGNTLTKGETSTLQIHTEIEPINIVYTKNNMTFYDLMVDILAIAGGSVATIGVINAIYHYLFAK